MQQAAQRFTRPSLEEVCKFTPSLLNLEEVSGTVHSAPLVRYLANETLFSDPSDLAVMAGAVERIFSRYNIKVWEWSPTRCFVAVASHEALGLALLSGVWIACYRYHPFERVLPMLPLSFANAYLR
ncbi:unnamed protein product [Schistocephalus solidus]|uniref:Glutathione S-transferase n=1 Tax=Schistocephalus solidus TaxID=70667 RepID=A0A183SYH9_SCHSO|nr:unnamed protein product [Schistocephalus solidus]